MLSVQGYKWFPRSGGCSVPLSRLSTGANFTRRAFGKGHQTVFISEATSTLQRRLPPAYLRYPMHLARITTSWCQRRLAATSTHLVCLYLSMRIAYEYMRASFQSPCSVSTTLKDTPQRPTPTFADSQFACASATRTHACGSTRNVALHTTQPTSLPGETWVAALSFCISCLQPPRQPGFRRSQSPTRMLCASKYESLTTNASSKRDSFSHLARCPHA